MLFAQIVHFKCLVVLCLDLTVVVLLKFLFYAVIIGTVF